MHLVKIRVMPNISYISLRKIQQAERNSSTLTRIDKNFYRDVSTFLSDLNNRLIEEKSPKKQILIREELQRIEKVINSIYEQREKKILIAAMTKSRGGDPNIKNILEEEKKLFEEVYNLLISTKRYIIGGKTELEKGEIEIEKEEAKVKEDIKIEENIEKGDEGLKEETLEEFVESKKTSKVNLEEKYSREANTNPVVRILEDVPSFVGLNKKTYHLKKGDIVSLPLDIYDALINSCLLYTSPSPRD